MSGLIQAMRDRHEGVRMWAAWSLGQIGHDASSAVGPLTELRSDRSEQVRLWAGRAIERIKNNQP